MKVTISGRVLEKFTRETKSPTGAKEERLFLRLFQEGERMNLDVNVKADTYTLADVGEIIELDDIKITSYKDVLYARQ